MASSVEGGKIVWCLLSTVAKLSGVFCPGWQKGVVSFVHPGKKCLVSFGSGVFCLAPVPSIGMPELKPPTGSLLT